MIHKTAASWHPSVLVSVGIQPVWPSILHTPRANGHEENGQVVVDLGSSSHLITLPCCGSTSSPCVQGTTRINTRPEAILTLASCSLPSPAGYNGCNFCSSQSVYNCWFQSLYGKILLAHPITAISAKQRWAKKVSEVKMLRNHFLREPLLVFSPIKWCGWCDVPQSSPASPPVQGWTVHMDGHIYIYIHISYVFMYQNKHETQKIRQIYQKASPMIHQIHQVLAKGAMIREIFCSRSRRKNRRMRTARRTFTELNSCTLSAGLRALEPSKT